MLHQPSWTQIWEVRLNVEWKWCHNVMVEADIRLRPLHTSILDIYKVFELFVCYPKGIWLHPHTVTLAKLAPYLGNQVHLRMQYHYGWGWYPPQPTSYIHSRHIQSVWAIGMLAQESMGAPLYSYTGQVGPRFGKSGSLVEWKWCLNIIVEANVHFRPLHASILDIYKVFELLVCCLKGIWVHPYTVRFGGPGSLVKWKWCHSVMVEADIHTPLIAIVSCKCPCSSSTPRGISSPHPNMGYQPAFPCKAFCRVSTNCKPWTCNCDYTLWAWSCWAHPHWPQALGV